MIILDQPAHLPASTHWWNLFLRCLSAPAAEADKRAAEEARVAAERAEAERIALEKAEAERIAGQQSGKSYSRQLSSEWAWAWLDVLQQLPCCIHSGCSQDATC